MRGAATAGGIGCGGGVGRAVVAGSGGDAGRAVVVGCGGGVGRAVVVGCGGVIRRAGADGGCAGGTDRTVAGDSAGFPTSTRGVSTFAASPLGLGSGTAGSLDFWTTAGGGVATTATRDGRM